MCKNKQESARTYKLEQTIKYTYWNKIKITYKTWIEVIKSVSTESDVQSGVRCLSQSIYIRWIESVSAIISFTSSHWYNQMSTISHSILWTVYYYVSEHNLSPVIDASHTRPITLVNRDLKLLNWPVGDIVHALGGFRTYSEPRPQFSSIEPGRTVRHSVTVTVISLYERWNNK